MLNLRHLRAVVAIAEFGTITGAARAISITQPAITQGLARLEANLNEALFERHTEGMHATHAADVFVPRAALALKHIGSSRVTMTQMYAFTALAREGSYSEASRKTGLSSPALHRAVNDLSIALQKPLVERRGKSLVLTEQGNRVARAFRLAESELRAGLSEIADLRGDGTNSIVVGAMPLSRAHLLPASIARFLADNPTARIHVVEGAFGELVDPLRDGEIDFLIGALRDPEPFDFSQHPLFVDRPIILGRRDHPLAAKRAKLKDLARYPWTIPPEGTPLRDNWTKWFEQHDVSVPSVPVECGSVITIREILRETDMLTVLSGDQVSVELEAGWLTKIGDVPKWFYRTIGVITRAAWRPTAQQERFLHQVHEAAKDI